MLRASIVVALLVAAGCGGSPSGPSPVPSPTPAPAPTARDGWTESAVAADFSPAAPAVGSAITVRAPGFLLRETAFAGEPLYLWPQDEAYVRELVYSEYVPGRRLSRWAGGFAVSPDGLDAPDVDTLHEAVAELSRATGLPIAVASGGAVSVVVDPGDARFAQEPPAAAVARLTFRGNVIAGARVIFADRRFVSSGRLSRRHNTLLHELGHVLGLGHSLDPGDVMSIDYDRRSERTFGERERITLKLMYRWRRPGNFFPDRDPGPGAATVGRTVVTVVD